MREDSLIADTFVVHKVRASCVGPGSQGSNNHSLVRKTNRFLLLWLSFLPFALYDSCHGWMVPAILGIAAVLCGIEEISSQIEEPLG